MKWSIKIATIFGIPIRVHLSFLLLLVLIALLPNEGKGGIAGAYGVILLLSIFFCVVLHELGHSLVAKGFNFKVESITLLPIGGVASMKSVPAKPIQEFLISAAGPAVSVALAIIFSLASSVLYKTHISQVLEIDSLSQIPFLARLAIINMWLAIFNLLPAFPMDGGRILRSIIWPFTGFVRATAIAGRVGQALAIVFFLLGLHSQNFWLVFIAIFIYFGAKAEAESAYWQEKLKNIPVSDFYNPNIVYVYPEMPISQANELARQTGQHNLPVMEGPTLAGMFSKKDLQRALKSGALNRPIKDFMSRRLTYCNESDNLANIIRTMIDKNIGYVAIIEDGQIKGIITQEGIWDILTSKENQRTNADLHS